MVACSDIATRNVADTSRWRHEVVVDLALIGAAEACVDTGSFWARPSVFITVGRTPFDQAIF